MTQLLTGCAVLEAVAPVSELASIQNQRAADAELALLDLDEIDALIKLDNRWLSNEIETSLQNQSVTFPRYSFYKIKLSFNKQFIELESLIDISDDDGNVVSATLYGEILLDFRGRGLEWSPRFGQLQIKSKDFIFENINHVEAPVELNRVLLMNLNTDIAAAQKDGGWNRIPLAAMPLAEFEVGASLPGLTQSPAHQTQDLQGFFMVTNSVLLIEVSTTSIALNLSFIPKLSMCPGELTVSRADFVNEVLSREPVGVVTDLNDARAPKYFYTAISGAKRPLTIIHYWFADGKPLAVEELPVGPSKRWRTWSSRGPAYSPTNYLEVLVVEKESACIILAKSIRKVAADIIVTRVDPTRATGTFSALRDAFRLKTSSFSIANDKPDIALVEITRSFVAGALQASLDDLSMDVEFDGSSLSNQHYSSRLGPFNSEDISCDRHDCPPAPACEANLAECKRLRDTRECTSCLFRNPLNNRCVSEVTDPLCEESRKRQNAHYDADRATCIANAELAKQECDQLNAQALTSCQIESGFEDSVCESVKTAMQNLEPSASSAKVTAETRTRGTLSANFSNFRIEGTLEGLKLDLSLESDLQQDGRVTFIPENQIGDTLSSCIADWSSPFKSRFATTPEVNNLLSKLYENNDMLIAEWSGFGLSVRTNPAPLRSVFVENPQLLANCKIGLTVNMVEKAMRGEDEAFFRGHVELEIQPGATSIRLAPFRLESNSGSYSARPALFADYIRYDIER